METLVLITSIFQWVISQIHLMDIFLSFLGMFMFIFIHQRLTTKGPILWPFVGIIPSLIRHSHELHDWSTRELIRCGGTFRFRGLWTSNAHGIVTSDPSKIEYMLKTNFPNFPKGKYYRERFLDLLGEGIFNADGATWKDQRRLAASEMHSRRFVEYSLKTMQSLVHEKLLPLVRKHATWPSVQEGPQTVDLQEWLLRFTFDNVCTVAFGVDPGCLTLDLTEVPFARALEEATEYTLFRFLVPPFCWKPMKWLNVGKERKLKEAIKVVHRFVDQTVKSRKVDDIVSSHNDLLSRMIELERNGRDLLTLSDKFLRDLCLSFILAGRDTSSVALTWFFWLVDEHPAVERKIVQEIDEIIKSRRRQGSTYEEVFGADELDRMVYLEAALSETMRLYPPVPIDFKEVEEDDVYPDGFEVRKGGRVFYSIYAMGRMKSIWGPDCQEFRPERWIRDSKFVGENQFKYLVFNAGPRLCVGKKFAYMQMKMVASSVLSRYKVKVKQGHVVAKKITTTLYMKHGLQVQFHPRCTQNYSQLPSYSRGELSINSN